MTRESEMRGRITGHDAKFASKLLFPIEISATLTFSVRRARDMQVTASIQADKSSLASQILYCTNGKCMRGTYRMINLADCVRKSCIAGTRPHNPEGAYEMSFCP